MDKVADLNGSWIIQSGSMITTPFKTMIQRSDSGDR